MRLLLRLGVEPDRIEIDELAVELGLLLGPQRLHRQHALAQQLEARLIARAVILHLLDIPAAAHGKDEAAARELVEARHRFGGDDGIALRDERDAGAELEGARRRRGEGQRDEGIVGVRIALGQLAAAREGRAAAHRDVGVLADEERVEAARLDRLRQLADIDAVIGRKVEDADEHGTSSRDHPTSLVYTPD